MPSGIFFAAVERVLPSLNYARPRYFKPRGGVGPAFESGHTGRSEDAGGLFSLVVTQPVHMFVHELQVAGSVAYILIHRVAFLVP